MGFLQLLQIKYSFNIHFSQMQVFLLSFLFFREKFSVGSHFTLGKGGHSLLRDL
ncbi:hypothetical protein DB41_AM00040 [Neochlamydia sp. TUME1]|nr:hypothetical protein DB41_AM00040 [Neochlamydia sp. TUME1]